MEITNKDGMSWSDAPLPPWLHRCRIWSSGVDEFDFIGRCPCGAIYIMGGWINKNETRISRLKDRFTR
jgi:hypothetical protein